MKNIPFFTTEFGVASLVLEEIPYKKEAYIRIQSSCDTQKFLDECVGFCKMLGAELILATGDSGLELYPLYTEIVLMEGAVAGNDTKNLTLLPVDDKTIQQWRMIYNENMHSVPKTATMTQLRAEEMLKTGTCYFVYDNDCLLGIGKVGDMRMDAIVSLKRGCGEAIMRALCKTFNSQPILVEVASNNMPAVALYRKIGFVEKESVAKWYCVYKK